MKTRLHSSKRTRRGARDARAAMAWALAAFTSAQASAAPITTNTALPVSKHEAIYRQQLIVSRASREAGDDVTEIATVAVLGYGVTGKLAVFGALPVVSRESDIGGVEAAEFGLGDASVFARRELFRRDGRGRTLRLAGFAGVTLPTGESGRTGDGSVDAFAGFILTAASTEQVLDAQIRYTANTEADGFERGDAASLDLSLQRRVAAIAMNGGQGYVFAVLEANATWSDRDRIAGVVAPDSGGAVAFLSPGLQFAAPRWIAETAVQIPVARHFNGAPLEPDYAFIASVRVNF